MSSRRSVLRAFLGRLTVAFGVSTFVMGGAVVAVNYVIDRKLDKAERVEVATAPTPPEGANFLVIGSDTRAFVAETGEEEAFGDEAEQGGQRSDTMMVVHVEPGAQRALVVSFPRDLWVEIPGEGMSKINSAFNLGPDKVIETLKANFDIDINHYIEVDFKSFRGIVQAIGSVPVYFPYPARDEKTGLLIYFPGCQRLNGVSSLAYVRSRSMQYYSSVKDKWLEADAVPDIDRIARQQEFIRSLAGLAVQKSLNNPFTANKIADRVLEHLTIDDGLSKQDIFDLIDVFRTINPDDTSALEFQTLPWANGPSQQGLSVLYPKEPEAEAMAARLRDFSGNQAVAAATDPSLVTLKVLNGTGREGVAQGSLDELVKAGFRSGGIGNDTRGTVSVTEVRYKPDALDKGKLVLKYVSPGARLVADSAIEGADVTLVLGSNFESIVLPAAGPAATPGAATPGAAPVPAATTESESLFGPAAPLKAPC